MKRTPIMLMPAIVLIIGLTCRLEAGEQRWELVVSPLTDLSDPLRPVCNPVEPRQVTARNARSLWLFVVSWPSDARGEISIELPSLRWAIMGGKGDKPLTQLRLHRAWYEHDGARWIPDALIPLKLGSSIDLPWRRNNISNQVSQAFVLEIFVPPSAAATLYQGQLQVIRNGRAVAAVTLSLDVCDVTLPDIAPSSSDSHIVVNRGDDNTAWASLAVKQVLAGNAPALPAGQAMEHAGAQFGMTGMLPSLRLMAWDSGRQDAQLITMLAERPGWNLDRIAKLIAGRATGEAACGSVRAALLRELTPSKR